VKAVNTYLLDRMKWLDGAMLSGGKEHVKEKSVDELEHLEA